MRRGAGCRIFRVPVAPDWQARRVVEIIAHRGASYDAPENTLAAARLAWAQGADALELDLHLTRDGHLAVIHDDDLQRVAGDSRFVAAATLAELRALEVGSWKNATFRGEKIPILEDVLAILPVGKRVFIEIKSGPEIIDVLERCLARSAVSAGQAVIISFDRVAAEAAKRAMPRHEACWIIDAVGNTGGLSFDAILSKGRELGIDGFDFESGWPLDERSMQQIHALGFKAYIWTVDEARKARRLAQAGVDGITTNRPGWLREQLAV